MKTSRVCAGRWKNTTTAHPEHEMSRFAFTCLLLAIGPMLAAVADEPAVFKRSNLIAWCMCRSTARVAAQASVP